MHRYITIIFLYICSAAFFLVHSQILVFENPEPELQRARIGLVDEFLKRFNGIECHPDIISSERDSLNINLLWLFDQDQFVNHEHSVQDSLRSDALEMIRVIQNDSIKLNYSDTTWTAIAHCKGVLYSKPIKFDIFLTVQSRGDNMYKWVINAVDGDCFNINPQNTTENLIISPDAHETKFIALKRLSTEQPYNIKAFLCKDFVYDPTSVFAFLVHSGKLKIEYVEQLEFVFMQVPGFAFHIQYFDRQSNNSGWLISNFYRFNEKDKSAFRKMINQQEGNEAIFDFNDSQTSPSVDIDTTTSTSEIIPIDNILLKRVYERINELQDYVGFIRSNSADKTTKQFYAKKLEKLFSSDAKVIVVDSIKGDTELMGLGKFFNYVINHKIRNFTIDAITSIVIENKKDNSETPLSIKTGIIPISVMDADVLPNVICEKLLPHHTEETEDGIEYIFDFGNLYITLKE